MAKRKRLTPLGPMGAPAPTSAPAGSEPQADPARSVAPIADMAGAASARAALDEVTETLSRARAEGRMVLHLPHDAIQIDYLVRDRIAVDDEEMTALVESLRARGQQAPIEVADLGDGRYGLISGWRRCRALRQLHEETGDDRFASVLALVRRPDQASDAYLAMVEENEIRVGLSYYERARIVAKAVAQGVFETEKQALQRLFHTASRPKRSKIGSFLAIVHALDGALRFPETVSERLGLSLSRALEDDPSLAPQLRGRLAEAAPKEPQAEQEILAAALEPPAPARPEAEPVPAPDEPRPGVRVSTGKDGRLVLQGPGVDEALKARLLAWLAEG